MPGDCNMSAMVDCERQILAAVEHSDDETFCLERFFEANDVVRAAASRSLYKRTPMISHWKDNGDLSVVSSECELYLKLENTQITGSYKVRGVLNQLHQFLQRPQQQQQQQLNGDDDTSADNQVDAADGVQRATTKQQHHQGGNEVPGLVTMSAGNYGKAFAFITAAYSAAAAAGGVRPTNDGDRPTGLRSTATLGRRLVVMPSHAPIHRQTVIESLGAEVRRIPAPDLVATVDDIIADGAFYHMQSINDDDLILGHGSVGLEILEDVPDPDVILVPCGGGALLAGVATTVKQSLEKKNGGAKTCRVYGIEPEGANTMWQSMQIGRPVSMPTACSIASGLAPPFAGDSAYRLCRRYVDDIIVVSDALIARAVTRFYEQGLVVEPSGAVGYAALSAGVVPDIVGRKVVLLISGGNITAADMANMFNMAGSN